jgi:hypothetical protein
MKAVLALLIIYVGTFLVAIQSSSPGSAQAAAPAAVQESASLKPGRPIDPQKEADIHALLELIGARDQVQEAVNNSAEQFREKLLVSLPAGEQGQAFVNTWAGAYQRKYDVDQVLGQLTAIYDQHYSEDEIKGLLQFYGSPVGQKVAGETPKITREMQTVSRETGAKAAKEALQVAKSQNPDVGHAARLGNGQRRGQQRGEVQTQAQADQQP